MDSAESIKKKYRRAIIKKLAYLLVLVTVKVVLALSINAFLFVIPAILLLNLFGAGISYGFWKIFLSSVAMMGLGMFLRKMALKDLKKNRFKTFSDLKFEAGPFDSLYFRASIDFNNGYRISVICGDYARSDKDRPYECSVFDKEERFVTKQFFEYDIFDDAEGYMTKDDVTDLMKRVQLAKG